MASEPVTAGPGLRAEVVERINFTAWPTTIITVIYTNWRGVTAVRRLRPSAIRFGSTEWHPEPQWLMEAEDVGNGEVREFAMKDMRPAASAPDPTVPPHD